MNLSNVILALFLKKIISYEEGIFSIIMQIYYAFSDTYPDLNINQIRDFLMLKKNFSHEFSMSTVKQISSLQITEMLKCINKPSCIYFKNLYDLYEITCGTKEIIGKYIQFKMKLFEKETDQSNYSMYYFKNISFEKINNMILLIQNNIKQPYVYWYSNDYNTFQIKQIIELKKTGIVDIWCGEALKYLETNQIEAMKNAKKENRYGPIEDSVLFRIIKNNLHIESPGNRTRT